MLILMNGIMNDITNGDWEYQEIVWKLDEYSGRLERIGLPVDVRMLIYDYVSEQNSLVSRYGILAYLLEFSDCKAMFLGKCLPTEVKKMHIEL